MTVTTPPSVMKGDFISHRAFAGVAAKIKKTSGISALFVSANRLSGEQTESLQTRLLMPVFTRYILLNTCTVELYHLIDSMIH